MPGYGRTSRALGSSSGLCLLALLWQILSGTGFPNQFFCDSWVVGFWRGRPWLAGCRIGETSLNVGSCVSESIGAQGTAPDVSAVRVGADRPWRSQEHSADGEAACARRM